MAIAQTVPLADLEHYCYLYTWYTS